MEEVDWSQAARGQGHQVPHDVAVRPISLVVNICAQPSLQDRLRSCSG